MLNKRSPGPGLAAFAAVAMAAFATVGVSPAGAHHCGSHGTHARDGGCLKQIKSPQKPQQSGQATGKRHHQPFRARMYYDQ